MGNLRGDMMNFRMTKMDDLPEFKVVYEKIIEEMNCNNIEIWNEIIDDNLTLHEYGNMALKDKY